VEKTRPVNGVERSKLTLRPLEAIAMTDKAPLVGPGTVEECSMEQFFESRGVGIHAEQVAHIFENDDVYITEHQWG
jgi:hypothetical protein